MQNRINFKRLTISAIWIFIASALDGLLCKKVGPEFAVLMIPVTLLAMYLFAFWSVEDK